MRIDSINAHYLKLAVSHANLENIQRLGRIVKFNGSPLYPEIEIELVLETDDQHHAITMEQLG